MRLRDDDHDDLRQLSKNPPPDAATSETVGSAPYHLRQNQSGPESILRRSLGKDAGGLAS
jgi:hypothetical protein